MRSFEKDHASVARDIHSWAPQGAPQGAWIHGGDGDVGGAKGVRDAEGGVEGAGDEFVVEEEEGGQVWTGSA